MEVTRLTKIRNKSLVDNAELREWAQQEVKKLLRQLGSWDAVAQHLKPFHKASRSAWWHVGEGRSITIEKINALRACNGMSQLPVYIVRRSHPTERRDKRRCFHVSPELFERLNVLRGAMTQEAFLAELADYLETCALLLRSKEVLCKTRISDASAPNADAN